jgi:hypothetical protein
LCSNKAIALPVALGQTSLDSPLPSWFEPVWTSSEPVRGITWFDEPRTGPMVQFRLYLWTLNQNWGSVQLGSGSNHMAELNFAITNSTHHAQTIHHIPTPLANLKCEFVEYCKNNHIHSDISNLGPAVLPAPRGPLKLLVTCYKGFTCGADQKYCSFCCCSSNYMENHICDKH